MEYLLTAVPNDYSLVDHITEVKAILIKPNKTTGQGKRKKVTKAGFALAQVFNVSRNNPINGNRTIRTKIPLLKATRVITGYVCKNPAQKDIPKFILNIVVLKPGTNAGLISQDVRLAKCDQLVNVPVLK